MENQIRALQQAGYEVDVFCLRSGPDEPRTSIVDGVQVFRASALPRLRVSRLRYLAEYASFGLAALVFLTRRQLARTYELIVVQTLPDFLVFSAVFAKLLGAKVVIDMRESWPEKMYQTGYDVETDHPAVRAVVASERLSLRFADAALTCTEQMRERFVSRGADPDKLSVMLNVADPLRFNNPVLPDPDMPAHNPFRIVIHGALKERYGHEVLIRAMSYVVESVHGVELDIIGSGPQQARLEALVEELELTEVVHFCGFLSGDEMMERLRAADCGVVPLISSPETELNHTVKTYEFFALGIPVIISRTLAAEESLDASMVCYFEPGNAEDLARAIIELHDSPQTRHELARNALDWYERHGPEQQKAAFLQVVEGLVNRQLAQ